MNEYLTVDEAAELLRLSRKTVANKMGNGSLPRGVLWFRPHGMPPRFKRAALVEWLESDRVTTATHGAAFDSDIRPARGRGRRSR